MVLSPRNTLFGPVLLMPPFQDPKKTNFLPFTLVLSSPLSYFPLPSTLFSLLWRAQPLLWLQLVLQCQWLQNLDVSPGSSHWPALLVVPGNTTSSGLNKSNTNSPLPTSIFVTIFVTIFVNDIIKSLVPWTLNLRAFLYSLLFLTQNQSIAKPWQNSLLICLLVSVLTASVLSQVFISLCLENCHSLSTGFPTSNLSSFQYILHTVPVIFLKHLCDHVTFCSDNSAVSPVPTEQRPGD